MDCVVVVGAVVVVVVVGAGVVVGVVFVVLNVVVGAVAAAVASVDVFGTVVFESLTALLYKIGAVIHPASIDVNTKTIIAFVIFLFILSFLDICKIQSENSKTVKADLIL